MRGLHNLSRGIFKKNPWGRVGEIERGQEDELVNLYASFWSVAVQYFAPLVWGRCALDGSAPKPPQRFKPLHEPQDRPWIINNLRILGLRGFNARILRGNLAPEERSGMEANQFTERNLHRRPDADAIGK